ncbi:MAG: type II toxin-antitoxin system RelE/ParE family toxin [Proteobacteria bacterium]|nr:type II toxin-antitoxin system RelE/ParE family toxin [Pseudomonadota bacterium]MBU1738957.1 type II toxin-antitoxin system RelE/ParE family toxin [Pseudomonadota bacterium]
MNYYFHPEALQEYSAATRYYAEILPSLAVNFVSQIENGINQILLHPQAWQPLEEDVRRCLVKRFPFGIYYTIEEDDVILIQAIMHLSRAPGYWKGRTAR